MTLSKKSTLDDLLENKTCVWCHVEPMMPGKIACKKCLTDKERFSNLYYMKKARIEGHP